MTPKLTILKQCEFTSNVISTKSKDKKILKYDKICKVCKAKFVAHKNAPPYCEKCNAQNYTTCNVCGKSFIITIHNRLICSDKCRETKLYISRAKIQNGLKIPNTTRTNKTKIANCKKCNAIYVSYNKSPCPNCFDDPKYYRLSCYICGNPFIMYGNVNVLSCHNCARSHGMYVNRCAFCNEVFEADCPSNWYCSYNCIHHRTHKTQIIQHHAVFNCILCNKEYASSWWSSFCQCCCPMKKYLYEWYEVGAEFPFYVGSGSYSRVLEPHYSLGKVKSKCENKRRLLGGTIEYRILYQGIKPDTIENLEYGLINYYNSIGVRLENILVKPSPIIITARPEQYISSGIHTITEDDYILYQQLQSNRRR